MKHFEFAMDIRFIIAVSGWALICICVFIRGMGRLIDGDNKKKNK